MEGRQVETKERIKSEKLGRGKISPLSRRAVKKTTEISWTGNRNMCKLVLNCNHQTENKNVFNKITPITDFLKWKNHLYLTLCS